MLPWDDEVSAQSRSSAKDWLDHLGRFIESRPVKVVLAVLIILSLLPEQSIGTSVEHHLMPLFLVAFGVEALVRAALLVRAGSQRVGGDYLFLVFDLVAFVSFLPLQRWFGALPFARTLTLLRLARLLLLLRFARELARDLYLIMTRREQLLQFGLVTFFVFALSFLSALLLVHGGVTGKVDDVTFSGELRTAFWWSFRQLESADNLVKDLAQPHWLVILLSVALTLVGVFVISFLIGIGTNVVEQVMRAERRRPVGYSDHALVIGPVEDSELLVREFVTLYDKNRMLRRVRPREVIDWLLRGGPTPRRHALPRMVLLGTQDEPPAYLYEEMMRWVVYRQGDGADPAALRLVGGARAKRVILLSRQDAGPDADALNVATLAALRAENPHGHVFVEVQEDRSRALVEDVGGPGTFPLDAPRMAGLFLCQHLVVPGVEHLYRELMDNQGSEFYTHIYVDSREMAALQRQGGTMPFSTMAARAYRDHQVVLAGVFLGGRGAGPPSRMPANLVPMEGLHQWVNPLVLPADDPLRTLGAAPDQVPLGALRGLIGVCSSYRPLRRYGRELARGPGAPPGPPPAALSEALASCGPDTGGLRRVLLCGFSTALPSLLQELDLFIPGIEVLIVIGERDDEHTPLLRKLELLGLGLGRGAALPGDAGAEVRLPRGGRAIVYTHEGPNLPDFAVRCMRGPVDAAVFLSEPDAADRDARTGMRVLRFSEALESRAAPRGERLHLLAEFVSLGKGERIQQLLRRRCCGFSDAGRLRVTIISTEHIKNYFMVRSAFVPGLTALFTELLGQDGQAVYRIGLPDLGAAARPLGLDDFREALRPRGLVPLALELASGRVLLNPAPRERFAPGTVRGLYVLRGATD